MTAFLTTFLDAAARNPDHPALIDGDNVLSYRILAESALFVADQIEDSVSLDHPVAVMMPKSFAAVAVILGTLISGRCYVPVDPSLPKQRRRDMLEDCRASLVYIAADAVCDTARALAPCAAHKSFNSSGRICLDRAMITRRFQCAPEQPAAILYTSGSTSKPKGVRLSRKAVDVFVAWAIERFAMGAGDRVASHAPFGFDISLLDLFASLAAGATVHLVPESQLVNGRFLVDFLRQNKITIWQSIPTPIMAIMREARARALSMSDGFGSLRHVLSTGEAIEPAILAGFAEFAPQVCLHNVYGCTETNDSFVFSCRGNLRCDTPLPIGLALPFVTYRIVDDNIRDVESGKAGELLIASPTAFDGYTDPDKTAEACVTLNGKRFFRSRDRVIEDGDGVLHFISRIDDTIKLRGYRIDLREVEACLACLPGVCEVAAVTILCPQKGKRLVGVISAPDLARRSVIALKRQCAGILPRQAIPDQFELRTDPLPRNANGKIDRRAVAAKLTTLESPPMKKGKELTNAHA